MLHTVIKMKDAQPGYLLATGVDFLLLVTEKGVYGIKPDRLIVPPCKPRGEDIWVKGYKEDHFLLVCKDVAVHDIQRFTNEQVGEMIKAGTAALEKY